MRTINIHNTIHINDIIVQADQLSQLSLVAINRQDNTTKHILSMSFMGSIFLLILFYMLLPQHCIPFISINPLSDTIPSNGLLRHLSDNDTAQIDNSTLIMELLSQCSSRLYTGKWTDDYTHKNGKMIMKINQARRDMMRTSEYLQILFRLNEGETIDNWVVISSTGKIKYLALPTNQSIEGSYFSVLEHGKNLDKPISEEKCDTSLRLEFIRRANGSMMTNVTNLSEHYNEDNDGDSNSDILLYDMVKGEFKSKCELNFTFTVEIEELYANYRIITVYSILVSTICLCSLFNSSWMIYKLDTSIVYGNSVSLITVSENIIWNAYGCLCHFFLSLSLNSYYIQFGLPSFLFFLNFTIIDIRLLYKLWSLKFSSTLTDPLILRRKLIQFYFMFYVIMFFSFFFVLKFYFDRIYIVIALLLTWIPQIVFNAIHHNKISMPIIFIFITAISRLFPSLYFRGYKHNFFDLSTDMRLIIVSIGIMVITTMFMYSQTLYGSRWFLPNKYKGAYIDLYKTKEEALVINPRCDKGECLICLEQLFQLEKTFTFPNDFVAEGENENVQVGGGYGVMMKKRMVVMSEVIGYVLDFHERSMNIHHKQFMVTPCNHIFHAMCLESWFKMKKECPSCRMKIDVELLN